MSYLNGISIWQRFIPVSYMETVVVYRREQTASTSADSLKRICGWAGRHIGSDHARYRAEESSYLYAIA